MSVASEAWTCIYVNVLHFMYCISMICVCVWLCLVVSNMYSCRCTVAASSNIVTLSLYVTHKKVRKANKKILSHLILYKSNLLSMKAFKCAILLTRCNLLPVCPFAHLPVEWMNSWWHVIYLPNLSSSRNRLAIATVIHVLYTIRPY